MPGSPRSSVKERFGELRDDTRFALRTLAKNPAFSLVAILTLALGIGANSAIFSVVNGVLLKPLAFPNPEQLVRVWQVEVVKGASNPSLGLRGEPRRLARAASNARRHRRLLLHRGA